MNVIEECSFETIHRRAADLIQTADVVLDIGCGIRPQQFVVPDTLVCVEPCVEYIEILKRNFSLARMIVVPADAMTALRAMPDESIDTIFMLDVIEHMTEEVGQLVLRECDRVARGQVVIFTPLGFMPQEVHADEIDGWNLGGGAYQEHKSGWLPENFSGFHSLVCRDLHKFDVKGRELKPPYGGFYAIKTKADSNSRLDNHVYDSARIASIEDRASTEIMRDYVRRNLRQLEIEIGLRSSQRLTELLVSKNPNESISDLFRKNEEFRSNYASHRSHEVVDRLSLVLERLRDSGSSFEVIDRELELEQREADVRRRETWVAEKEKSLAAHEGNLNAWEADVRRREASSGGRVRDGSNEDAIC